MIQICDPAHEGCFSPFHIESGSRQDLKAFKIERVEGEWNREELSEILKINHPKKNAPALSAPSLPMLVSHWDDNAVRVNVIDRENGFPKPIREEIC